MIKIINSLSKFYYNTCTNHSMRESKAKLKIPSWKNVVRDTEQADVANISGTTESSLLVVTTFCFLELAQQTPDMPGIAILLFVTSKTVLPIPDDVVATKPLFALTDVKKAFSFSCLAFRLSKSAISSRIALRSWSESRSFFSKSKLNGLDVGSSVGS